MNDIFENVVINEFLADNSSINQDEYNEFDDWLELYNFSDDTINLKGFYLSDSKEDLTKFQINTDILLEPQNYIVFWCDNEPEQGFLHTNFKLSKDGESIYLSNAGGILLDSLQFYFQKTNVSFGRSLSDSLLWEYFETPTPGNKNHENGYKELLEEPSVNKDAGFYTSPICLELLHSDIDVKIVYTLNGDEPDTNSTFYESCLTINENAVIRFRAIKEGCISSPIKTKTYFFNSEHDLDIVSIVAPGNGLVGSTGILDKDDTELEKLVHFEYFGNDHTLKFQLNGGLQIHSPKKNPQYSVRFYARSEYGEKYIKYPIFENKKIERYKRLVLRNSGNDGTVSGMSTLTHLRDGFHQTLLQKIGHPQAVSSFKPVNLYVNGEYYGIYNLRERIDKYFIESNYDYKGDMDLIERNWFEPEKKHAFEGNFNHYDSICETVLNNNNAAKNYETLNSNINLDQYIDYCILEIYIGNFDWILNNVKAYRPYAPDSKFEFILWDTDHGSGMPYEGYGRVSWNTFDWAISVGKERTEDPLNTVLLRRLLEYEPARNQFLNRFADLMNTILGTSNTTFVIDSIGNLIANDMKLHSIKWNTSYSGWEDALEYVKNFHAERPSIVFNHLKNYYKFNDLNDITLSVNDPGAGKIKINSILPELLNDSWTGTYFSDVPISLQAIPFEGYQFAGWSTPDILEEDTINLTLETDTNVKAYFYLSGTDSPFNLNDDIYKAGFNHVSYDVYPNPAVDHFIVERYAGIESSNTQVEIVVFDMLGKKCIHESHSGRSKIVVKIGNIKSGLYLINVFENKELKHAGKINIIK